MDPILDIFNQDAFSFVSLTDSILKVPFIPGRVGELGLFTQQGVPTTSIAIEEYAGQLALVQTSPRGGPGAVVDKKKRTARLLKIPHIQRDDNIMAEEVQNVREFGVPAQPRTVATYMQDRMSIHANAMDTTIEWHRVGAINGIVLDADNSVIYNLFDEFQLTQPSSVSFALATATTQVRKKCTQIIRSIGYALGGVPYTGVSALCGDDFWDALVDHPEVRDTYKYQQESEGAKLRARTAWGTFMYGGIQFENYRGYLGGFDGSAVTPFIAADQCRFFPTGAPNLFKTYYAPADYMETVNTMGLPRYAKGIPSDNNKSLRLEMQTNPLSICLRPNSLITGTLA